MNLVSQNIQFITRWETYLTTISKRFEESLRHAREACETQLVESNYDYYTTFRTWTAIKSQIQDICTSVESTWDQKMKPHVESHHLPPDLQCGAFIDNLHEQLDEFDIILQGKLSNLFYQHSIKTIEEAFKCSQCHAPLKPKEGIFRAHYVSCAACQATNTFSPNTKYIQIGWNVIDNMIGLQLLPRYKQLKNTLRTIHQQRPPVPEDYWKSYKDQYLSYWENFFQLRITYNADARSRYQEDLNRKLREYEQYEKTYKKSY